jgi:hypothetical protein
MKYEDQQQREIIANPLTVYKESLQVSKKKTLNDYEPKMEYCKVSYT